MTKTFKNPFVGKSEKKQFLLQETLRTIIGCGVMRIKRKILNIGKIVFRDFFTEISLFRYYSSVPRGVKEFFDAFFVVISEETITVTRNFMYGQ